MEVVVDGALKQATLSSSGALVLPVVDPYTLKSGTFKARGTSVSSLYRGETEAQHERAGPR